MKYFLHNKIEKSLLKNSSYPTAKPSTDDYRTAKELLKGITVDNKKIRGSELVEVIAYLNKYKSIKYSIEGDYGFEASKCLATAPWMGKWKDNFYKEHIDFLCEKGIITCKNGRLYLATENNPVYHEIELKEAENSFRAVYDYLMNLGDDSKHISLKMSVFHARTIMKFENYMKENGQPLVDLLRRFPNLYVKILCVGKYSGDVAKEGANREQLENATMKGIVELYKSVPEYRGRIHIGMVRDNIVDASIRATILIEDNRIEFCHFKLWRTGYERAIYGKSYDAGEKSSMALQINQLFDDAFSRAVPIGKKSMIAAYWLKKLGKFALFLGMIVALNLLFFEIPNLYNGVFDGIDFISIIIEIVGVLLFERLANKIYKKICEG